MKAADVTSILEYLLSSELNGNVNPETGVGSNDRLRSVFMALLGKISPRVFLDIGARDGESAIAVTTAFPQCRSYAFEANPHIYEQFAGANAEHGLIDYRNLAVGDSVGTIELFIPRISSEVVVDDEIVEMRHVEAADTGRSSLLRRTDQGAEYDVAQVPVTTLDGFCRKERIAGVEPMAVWIDVEGAAGLVIAGGRKTLRGAAIVFIEVEGHAFWDQQDQSHTVVGQLVDMGFVPIARDREYYDKQFNVIMVRNDLLHLVSPLLFDAKSVLSRARATTARLETLEKRVAALESASAPTYPPVVGRFTPIVIPVFNNPTFLRAMVEQLDALHHANIVVLDNASTYPPMLDCLEEVEDRATVRRLTTNAGPRRVWNDPEIFELLPQVFAVTDPDLLFGEDLPRDFIEQLFALSVKHRAAKVGMALDISDVDSLRQDDFVIAGAPRKIWDWERQFWRDEVEPGVYRALIDTTFAVYNKEFFDLAEPLAALRVGGPFTCTHLPWLRSFQLPSEELDYYRRTNSHSFYLPSASVGPPSA